MWTRVGHMHNRQVPVHYVLSKRSNKDVLESWWKCHSRFTDTPKQIYMIHQNTGWNCILHMVAELPEEVFIYCSKAGLQYYPKAGSVVSWKNSISLPTLDSHQSPCYRGIPIDTVCSCLRGKLDCKEAVPPWKLWVYKMKSSYILILAHCGALFHYFPPSYHFTFILYSFPPGWVCCFCFFLSDTITVLQWFSLLFVTLLCEAKAQVDVKCPTLQIQDTQQP